MLFSTTYDWNILYTFLKSILFACKFAKTSYKKGVLCYAYLVREKCKAFSSHLKKILHIRLVGILMNDIICSSYIFTWRSILMTMVNTHNLTSFEIKSLHCQKVIWIITWLKLVNSQYTFHFDFILNWEWWWHVNNPHRLAAFVAIMVIVTARRIGRYFDSPL